ncbi:hypothetical protein E2C01_070324 [Portunus trituberculatus]|uniref:Uncharacterized protein n=1 Tax=Portunus trituberculatus TaxID=210409 RepID=A0A5B7I538_PORTR|nr:hypothetical protein [Portunus trituberculatus]
MRDGGIQQRVKMSAVTRFKQSVTVSHGKEHKAHQPLPASATPHSVLTCITYVSLVSCDPFCPWCRTTLRPWNISCFNAHASSLNILHYAPSSSPWPSQHSTCPSSWGPQASIFPSNLLSFALCLLEEDWPATTPVILTHEYPRTHKDP